MKRSSYPHWLNWVLILAIALGVCFRFLNLDRKIFWHDEVYTSMRAAGYTRSEIDTELFQNKMFSAPMLQKFQQIKPGSTPADTVRSLETEDPQHPPMYFLIARVWMQIFGGSILAARSLPALLSLLSLPLMYALAMELFASQRVAVLSTALIALSPFDILFAQTARQYGLLATAVIGSTWLLARAMRLQSPSHWGLYALSLALGLYTHPFFALTMVAQGSCVLLLSLVGYGEKTGKSPDTPKADVELPSDVVKPLRWRWLLSYAIANSVAMLLYSPWMKVLLGNSQRALATTDWARAVVPPEYLLKLWTLSFSSLFFDLDFGFNNPLTYVARIPFILLIFVAVGAVYLRTPRRTWVFVVLSIFVPFLLLALPDLLTGGKRSAVSRYLISCFPGVQLAVGFLLAIGLSRGNLVWRWVLALVFAASIISCGTSAMAETWWDKDLSYSNAEVAQLINTEASQSSPIVLSDIGDDYTNTGDLISLSYRLKDNVRLYLTQKVPDLAPLTHQPAVLVFRPSMGMREAIAQKGWQITAIDQTGGQLWRLKS